MRHHGGQNVVESQGATERVHNKFLPQYFYHNIKVKENAFFLQRELKKASRDTLTRAALPGLLSTTEN